MWGEKKDKRTLQDIFHAARNNDLEKFRTLIESGKVSPVFSRCLARNHRKLAYIAAKRGNLDIVKYLVDRDPSILKYDLPKKELDSDEARTLLEAAVQGGHLNIVKYLVEKHCDEKIRQRSRGDVVYQFLPIGLALRRGHLDIIKYFIEERSVNVDTGLQGNEPRYDFDMDPLIFIAYENEHHNITNYLIEEKKANLTVLDKNKRNILYHAVGKNDLDFVKYILDEKKANIDVNWRDKDGRTLLHEARFSGDVDLLQYLVEQKKADVNIPENKRNETPLHEATRSSTNYQAFKFLVDHGSDLEKKDKDGATPLHLAATISSPEGNFDEKLLYLLQRGANVNEKNNKGEKPIDIILTTKRIKASEYLIDSMEDVDVRNDKGETLLHRVASLNQTELLDYLVSKKHAKVDVTRIEDEWTPLHCAASCNHLAVCKYLVQHGANTRAKDKAGRDPAQVASKEEVINFIQNASPKVRNRRSISPSIWVPALQLRSREHILEHVCRQLKGRATITSGNETRPSFHLHSFLLLTNFFARYLFLSARTKIDEFNFLGSAENSQNRMDSVAEEAVRNFLDI